MCTGQIPLRIPLHVKQARVVMCGLVSKIIAWDPSLLSAVWQGPLCTLSGRRSRQQKGVTCSEAVEQLLSNLVVLAELLSRKQPAEIDHAARICI